MPQPSQTQDIFKKAKSARERARAAADHSTRLLHETARHTDEIHRTETALKELKDTVRGGRKASERIRRQTKKSA